MPLKKQAKIGYSFDEILAEEGILEEREEQAIKQILADKIKSSLERERLTAPAIAARMRTSR